MVIYTTACSNTTSNITKNLHDRWVTSVKNDRVGLTRSGVDQFKALQGKLNNRLVDMK